MERTNVLCVITMVCVGVPANRGWICASLGTDCMLLRFLAKAPGAAGITSKLVLDFWHENVFSTLLSVPQQKKKFWYVLPSTGLGGISNVIGTGTEVPEFWLPLTFKTGG